MKFQGVDYFNMDDLLTDEEKMARNLARDFFEKEVEPLVADAFHQEKPPNMAELAPRMGELGMIGCTIPREDGGGGTSYLTYGMISQEADRVDSGIGSFIRVETGLVMYPIWRFGSTEQKEKWLPSIAQGRKIGCFGLTEPNHGSDVAGMETTAKKDGNGWIINGTKQWISEAHIADLAILWANTDQGLRGFLVERGTEGFSQNAITGKGSMRTSDVGELVLADCRVPEETILPGTRGISSPLTCLNQARYAITWGAIGVAMDCYETALNYTKERVQFGSPIASFQLVQEKLVEMLVEITKAQLLTYRLGRMMEDGTFRHQQISMTKKNNVLVARMCARTARELLGANGISLEFSPIRHMANLESLYTYEGTDHIHTLILGQDITGIPAFQREL